MLSQRSVQPPCQAACPAGVRTRDYLALIAQGRYLDAVSLIRERMPFLSACGRICYHPCEIECNRGSIDEPLALMYLKRFVADYAYQAQLPPPMPVEKTRTEKIAVIGAGPCGLTVAQDLTHPGYPLTVFEALPFPGGTVRAALPPYRLPQKLVDWDIENILALGIELKTNTALGRDFSLKELQEEGYAAIFIATGADRSRKLSQPNVGIFAEGDLAFGTIWTVHAVAAGHKGAISIENYLQGESVMALSVTPTQIAKQERSELEDRVLKGQIKLKPRPTMPLWEPFAGKAEFSEMELGYSEEMALHEAQRCLGCGATEIIEEKCTACLTCLRVCPYEAPVITPAETVEISVDRCRACGICVSGCPARAIAFTMPGIEDVVLQIEAALKQATLIEGEPIILGVCCSYWAIGTGSFESIRARYPNIGIVPLLCVTKIDTVHLLRAFELGFSGVFVAACKEVDCPYEKSIFWAKRTVDNAKEILAEVGFGAERLEMYNLSAFKIEEFEELVAEFLQRIKQIGSISIEGKAL